ncbi:MAG: hypothetical protein G8345_19670, partial [Magnetococcales bacterium]|nr:hypothetical protein [Magnetococcales bacterium]
LLINNSQVYIREADSKDNTSITDLVTDLQAAIDKTNLDITVKLYNGLINLTNQSTTAFTLSANSVNADLLGLQTNTTTSTTFRTLDAPGKGSTITLGSEDGSGGRLILAGNVRAYSNIALYSGQMKDAVDISLSSFGTLETINGSINLASKGDATFDGRITAGGAGSTLSLHADESLVIGGILSASQKISLSAGSDNAISKGTTSLETTATSQITTTAANSEIHIVGVNDVVINSQIGVGVQDMAVVEVRSTHGTLSLDKDSGRIETDGLLRLGGLLDLQGVVKSTAVTAATDDYEVEIDTSGSVALSGDFSFVGSISVQSSDDLVLSNLNFMVKDDGQKIRFAADNDVLIEQGTIIQGSTLVDIQAVGLVEVQSGVKVMTSSANSSIHIKADELTVIGSLLAGAKNDDKGSAQWVGDGSRIQLEITDAILVGGNGLNEQKETVLRGGTIQASDQVDIVIDGGKSAIAFSMNELSLVSSGGNLQFTSDREVHLAGTIESTDADIQMDADGLILVNGFIQAHQDLSLSGSGDNAIILTTLAFKEDVRVQGGILATGKGGSISLTGSGDLVVGGQIGNLYKDGNGIFQVDTDQVTLQANQGDILISGQVEANKTITMQGVNLSVLNESLVKTRGEQAVVALSASDTLLVADGGKGNDGSVVTSGLLHLHGKTVEVDGLLIQSDQAGRLLINASSLVTLNGSLQSAAGMDVHAGVGTDWDNSRLTASMLRTDLVGGDILLDQSGRLEATGTVTLLAGGDVTLSSGAAVKDGSKEVKAPVITTKSTQIDVVTGYHQVADGFVEIPVVEWTTTLETVEVSRIEVKIGYSYHTLDVTLDQDGYYTTDTSGSRLAFREYFVAGVDYNNSDAIPWSTYATTAPAATATFAELTSAQQDAVLDFLNYGKLFDLVTTNPVTHKVEYGVPSETPWTEWTSRWNDAVGAKDYTIAQMSDVDLWSDYFVRIPTGVAGDFAVEATVVSQGTPSSTSEVVGKYQDQAEVFYQQDKSIYVAETLKITDPLWSIYNSKDASTVYTIDTTDLDKSAGRWVVVYKGGDSTHERIYDLTDSDNNLSLTWTPDWATGANKDYVVTSSDKSKSYTAGYYDSAVTLVEQQESTSLYTQVDGNTSYNVSRLVNAPAGYALNTTKLAFIEEQPTLRPENEGVGSTWIYTPSAFSLRVDDQQMGIEGDAYRTYHQYVYGFDANWLYNRVEFKLQQAGDKSATTLWLDTKGAWDSPFGTFSKENTIQAKALLNPEYDYNGGLQKGELYSYDKMNTLPENYYSYVVKSFQDTINQYPFWDHTIYASDFKTWLASDYTLAETKVGDQTISVERQVQDMFAKLNLLVDLQMAHDILADS